MPLYTYRREDGTTFDFRQKFTDEPLAVDPQSGQPVVRVVQAAGIIFKGTGFYVNDSKSASKASISSPPSSKTGDAPASKPAESAPVSEAKPAESKPLAAAAD